MRLPLAIAMLGVIALGTAGCSLAPSAQFYQLQQPESEQTQTKNNATVLLGPLKIADYLQRENLLQREADGSLRVSQQARWAGSLQDDIGQFVLRQIAAQLGSSRIALYPDRVGIEAQAQVVLSISRLDSGVEQPAVLEAQWRLLDSKGVLRDSQVVRFTAQHNGEMSDQVRAQSDLLNQLTKQLVTALRKQLPSAVTRPAAARGNGAVSNKKPTQAPLERLKIPEVGTPRELEVYRF